MNENIENDDFCDLPDGSDETKTSACSHLKVFFTCAYDQKSIPTSRVQDGVCDCCDGSDEVNTPFPVLCPVLCGPNAVNTYQFLPSRLRRGNYQRAPVTLPKIHLHQDGTALHSASRHSHSDMSPSLHRILQALPLLAIAVIIFYFIGKYIFKYFSPSQVLPLQSSWKKEDPRIEQDKNSFLYFLGITCKKLVGNPSQCWRYLFRWRKSDSRMN